MTIFEGESHRALIARVIYRQLMAKEAVSYYSVLEEYKFPKPVCPKISEDEYMRSEKKAFKDVFDTLKARIPNCIEEGKDNHNHKTFRYIGEDSNPLEDIINVATIRDLHTYFDFCQNSAGLMPQSWLEYFFKNTKDLQEIKKRKSKHEQIIIPDYKELKNIELLPKIYDSIVRKEPFRITYQPYKEDEREWIIHPHYLREYNGRWYVLCYREDLQKEDIYILALDRITSGPDNVSGVNYIPADQEQYSEKFDQIIGVTRIKDTPISIVRVRSIYDRKIWGLLTTKPLHASQSIVKDFDIDQGYGDIELQVAINKELISRILHYGEFLEVLDPLELRATIEDKIRLMCQRYNIPSK